MRLEGAVLHIDYEDANDFVRSMIKAARLRGLISDDQVVGEIKVSHPLDREVANLDGLFRLELRLWPTGPVPLRYSKVISWRTFPGISAQAVEGRGATMHEAEEQAFAMAKLAGWRPSMWWEFWRFGEED